MTDVTELRKMKTDLESDIQDAIYSFERKHANVLRVQGVSLNRMSTIGDRHDHVLVDVEVMVG